MGKQGEPSPKTFGKYTILREIAHGGKGIVYEALDTVLNRKVALKMILPQLISGPEELKAEAQRFLAEARMSATLPKHPHIVSVYEAGEIEGKHYLAMELVDGHSMTRWLKKSAPPLARQVEVLREIALAIDQAHKSGVIHRDLKPQNILVDVEDRPHITDFGLAKVAGREEDLTQSQPGKVWGTPSYMSPEHARNLPTLDHRSDIYSLGVMLYEALAGRPPFKGPSPQETMTKLLGEPVPPPSTVTPDGAFTPTMRQLERICLKALAKDPDERHPTAAAFAEDLARATAKPARTVRAVPKRNPALTWGIVGAIAAALLLGFLFLGGSRDRGERDVAQAERLMKEEKYQEALLAYERALAKDAGSVRARQGQEDARRRIDERRETEKREVGDAARSEAERLAKTVEDRFKGQMEAARKAEEERSLLLKAEQFKLEAGRQAAEERARTAEEAAKKAHELLTKEPEKPAKPAPEPKPAAEPLKGAPAVAPLGDPRELPDGSLVWEAENYTGGAKSAAGTDYHDTTPGNQGNTYRPHDVDIRAIDGGFVVDHVEPGEWLRYRFSAGGRFRPEIRHSGPSDAVVHVEIDGTDVTGPVTLPKTDPVDAWDSTTGKFFDVAPGDHVVRLVFKEGRPVVDSFRFTKAGRLPPPEPVAARASRDGLRNLFKEDYAKRDPASLARKLLERGDKTRDDPATQFALYSEAADLAAKSGNLGTALATIDRLAARFNVEAIPMKVAALEEVSRAIRTPQEALALTQKGMEVMEEAVERELYEEAMELASQAQRAVRKARDANLALALQERTREIRSLRDEFRKLQASLKTIGEKPDDPEACLAVGLYRCFARADWKGGLPLLAKGSDADLAALAKRELDPPATPGARAALGDAWYDLARKKQALKNRFLSRAAHWYEEALPGLDGLEQLRVDRRLQELYKILWGSGIPTRDLAFWVEPGRDPGNGFRELLSGTEPRNLGCTIVDSGARAISCLDSSLQFDAPPALDGVGDFGTILAWVKTDNVEQWAGMVDRGNRRVDDFGLWIDQGHIGIMFNWPRADGIIRSDGKLTSGKWAFCGATWDPSTVTFYIDGRPDRTASHPGPPERRSPRIHIGDNPPGESEHFTGLIGSVMIYGRLLPPAEVRQIYGRTRSTFR